MAKGGSETPRLEGVNPATPTLRIRTPVAGGRLDFKENLKFLRGLKLEIALSRIVAYP